MYKKGLRIFHYLIVFSIIITSLAGCGKNETTDVDNQTTVSTQQNTQGTQTDTSNKYAKYQPVQGKKYVFSIIGQQNGPMLPKEEQIIAKHFEDKLGITINFVDIDPTKYLDIINLKFASGERFDKFFVPNFDTYVKWVNQDLAAELPEDLIKNLAPNIFKIYNDENPKAFSYAKVNSKVYGIPMYRNWAEFRNPIVWRGDWLKNVGIQKIPDTLQEFEQAFYKFTNDDPDKNNKKDTFGFSATSLDTIYLAFGYTPTSWSLKDGKLVYGAIQPEMKEALTLLNKWYKDKVIDPEFVTGENKGGYWAISHAFVNGRIGLSCMGNTYHWKIPLNDKDQLVTFNALEMQKVNETAYKELSFGQPPVGPTGKRGITQEPLIQGAMSLFGKQLEKEPDKLGMLLKFYDYVHSSFDNFLTATSGFEGKTYVWENEATKPINGYEDLKKLQGAGGNTNTTLGTLPFAFGAIMFKSQTEFARKYKMNENGVRNELIGGLPSSGKYLTELSKIQTEAYLSIIDGTKPISFFDEFVSKWKSAGGDQLIKEANEWYNNTK